MPKILPMYKNDPRIVITLDAGGSFFRFTAIKSNQQICPIIEYPSEAKNLDKCLANMVKGFESVIALLPQQPVAISFAFPGPADYPQGIFPTHLTNFPAFSGGVALGPFLKNRFNIPVFINNDADLFTYGEALAGALPYINARLKNAGSPKEYHNMIGFILGTGFGFGLTSYNKMFIGDNCCSEIYCLPHKLEPELIAEEGASLRAVVNYYKKYANDPHANTYQDSYEIFQIAEEKKDGDTEIAKKAFATFGEIAGYTIAHAACMLDGIIVLGGGVSKAHKYYMPSLLQQIRATAKTKSGITLPIVPSYIYNLEDEIEFSQFIQGDIKEYSIPGTTKKIKSDSQKRLGIITSTIGTSTATMLGAYNFALYSIDNQ